MTSAPDVVIAGGTVVTDSWSGPATVVVSGERIAAIVDADTDLSTFGAARIIDAAGKIVMPGAVDPHFHLLIPLGAFMTCDNFETASLAALAGGTTTVIDFAIPAVGQDPIEALDDKIAAGAESRCDYAFHGCLSSAPVDAAETISQMAKRGVRTIKLFTTYRGELMVGIDTIESVMRALTQVSGLTYIHAEENEAIEAAQAQAEAEGRIGARGMAASRPEAAEESAVAQVLGAAERTGAPVYFVHQSIPSAVDLVDAARLRGIRAYSETCPHYLVLDETCYEGQFPERFVCCPPIRSAKTVAALGDRLAVGRVHTIGSDHCCYSTSQKEECSHDVRIMPNGLPGVETRLSVVWNRYVCSGQISPEDFVRMMCSNPARLNGLYPRKGAIAPGSDADLVIFDPDLTRIVTIGDLHMDTDYTPYEGMSVTGWTRTVLMRGTVVVEDGVVIDPGPIGRQQNAGPITFW
ncbi:MAG: dihydropyrimidinase [Actinomycetes bacterium]